MASEDFFGTLRKRFQMAVQSESRQRQEMLEDLKYRVPGGQWPEHIKRMRELDGRPCLEVDRLSASIRQVTNDIRQNRPSPAVSPVDDAGDVDTAEVFQGLIRHIERQSNAEAVRSYAADYAVSIGRGFYRITTDFASPTSFDQEIYLKRIKNPFAVYMDPSAQEPDYSDAKWGFVIDHMARDEFRRQFPRSRFAVSGSFRSTGDTEPLWVSSEGVQVAEYFHIDYKERTLALLADGTTAFSDEITDRSLIIKERPTQIPTVYWCKTNGFEKLEETTVPGPYIPIIPILGEELDVDGETHLLGMTRRAKGVQSMYSMWATAETEIIALAPKSPYVAAEGQLEGYEQMWKEANVRNRPWLYYKPKELGGRPLPPPQRQTFEPPVAAISQARAQAADDLKATTGIYDASLGARSNETSGKAILARQREGDVGNYHFSAGVRTGILHETRILTIWIPHYYDRPGRVARIIGENGDERLVTLNAPFEDKGIRRIYALGAGKYDVAVDVGPSHTTQRQEAVASMLEFIRVYPAAAQLIGDLLAKNMDWPGAREISERLKRMLPPELQDEEEIPVPPKVRAKLEALTQQHDALAAALNEATEKLERKTAELESKERIEALRHQRELIKMALELDSTEAIAMLKAEMAATERRLDLLREDEPVDNPQSAADSPQQQ